MLITESESWPLLAGSTYQRAHVTLFSLSLSSNNCKVKMLFNYLTFTEKDVKWVGV